MTGVFTQDDDGNKLQEIKLGDTLEFSGVLHKVVLMKGEQGLEGYFAQSLQIVMGKFSYVRYPLEALNPKKVRVV